MNIFELFEVGCLHQLTVISLYGWHRNEKLLKSFTYPSDNRAFTDRK